MKRGLIKTAFTAIILSIIFMSWETTPKFDTKTFEQHPPIPEKFWVQKLKKPTNSGSMILSIQFVADKTMPKQLPIYSGKSLQYTLKDDGVYPDKKAADHIYACISKQDPKSFVADYQTSYATIIERGYQINYTGHLGKVLDASRIKPFPIRAFNSFAQVEVNPNITNEPTCNVAEEINKPKSLWISDLRVVEDPARTYNIINQTGNPLGAWTFGTLMKNMAGGLNSDSTPEQQEKVRNFLKTWVLGLGANYSLNGQLAKQRDPVLLFKFIIQPWLLRAMGISNNTTNMVSLENWQSHWDEVDLNALLSNAPFKLTAIVNRMDLRGNSAYSAQLSNSGETRFIYSLISAYNYNGLENNSNNMGNPPFSPDTDFSPRELLDWQGMNVILEYGNVETDKCDVKQRALDWMHLSELNMEEGLETYLAALEVLTNKVTDAGVKPSKPNGSAINQVRSNEKLLFELSGNGGVTPTGWENADWQLRQFELNSQGFLVNAPVTNVPLTSNNFAPNIEQFNQPTNSTEVLDWIYSQTNRFMSVKQGNHNLPNELLQPVSNIKGELMHYFGLDFWNENMNPTFFNKYTYNGESSLREKDIRRQLSLNTCAGCHSAETKTFFTMVRPLGYGEEANYWDPIPATHTGRIDNRFYGTENGNKGFTFEQDAPVEEQRQANYKANYYAGNNRTVPVVSPFITGRNYRGTQLGFQDDLYSNALHPDNDIEDEFNSVSDNKLTGLFYVNDPSNAYETLFSSGLESYLYPSENVHDYDSNNLLNPWLFPQLHDSNNSRHGFNELDLRSKDLCRLAHSCCLTECKNINTLVNLINFMPFPEHGN